ncbi:MAG: nickel pincer cofactor biosynthesis protein LarB [Magnetococcales bacterium]|nr:nickel pincer cofactor biosynthesis protein LarB [Magnetococcales bacterium]
MEPRVLEALLREVAAGRTGVADALERLRCFPVDAVADGGEIVARLDTHRRLRQGFPEVILAQGKRFDHLRSIVERALGHDGDLLITRLGSGRLQRLQELFPELQSEGQSGCLYRQRQPGPGQGLVGVLCAGTSDIPVAQEAALTARLLGARVETWFDAGVAGLHRLLAAGELLRRGRVFVVAAGMEGALPSVVGGLVDRPVIAVPTDGGYGTAFGGVSALLGMLNSCAANVTVVNINNGFGAGYVAGLINRGGEREEEHGQPCLSQR